MKRVIYLFLLVISLNVLSIQVFANPIKPINKVVATVNSNFIQIDIESDNLISKGKIYSRSDALELRRNLEEQLQNNPSSLALSLALVKFHSNASIANGGFKGIALQYAANIFKYDEYLGCLAYEYIYLKFGEIRYAEVWYKNSFRCSLPEGMEWREVKLNQHPALGASIVGNFSNGKQLPLYQNIWSSYVRRIMVPKCYGDCSYKVISNFLDEEIMIEGKLVQQNW